MATIRSSSGRSSISAFSSVVLPDPVPPETRMLRRDERAVRAARRTASGSEPMRTRSSGENARPPNRRMVMATSGLAGGVQMATLDPSLSLASRIGFVAGSSPKWPGDVDRRTVEPGGGEPGRLVGLEASPPARPRRCRVR